MRKARYSDHGYVDTTFAVDGKRKQWKDDAFNNASADFVTVGRHVREHVDLNAHANTTYHQPTQYRHVG